jgi:hypothetical protein
MPSDLKPKTESHIIRQSLVLEYRRLGDTIFWQKYSRAGRRLTFTEIMSMISTSHRQRNQELATAAKELYGDAFESLFRYKCSRRKRWVVMTDEGSIARRFLAMT